MDDTTLTKPTKAIVAFVVSGVGAIAVAAADNSITLGEALAALGVAVAAAAAVYGVKNAVVNPPASDSGSQDV